MEKAWQQEPEALPSALSTWEAEVTVGTWLVPFLPPFPPSPKPMGTVPPTLQVGLSYLLPLKDPCRNTQKYVP